jgi:CCR4-NOT transcription complex subunit 2
VRPSHPGLPGVLSLSDQSTPQLTQQVSSKPEPMQTSSFQRPQNNDFGFSSQDISNNPNAPEVQDPLAGMSDRDRWGLKGYLSILKGPYQDQAALLAGIDITSLGIDQNSLNE